MRNEPRGFAILIILAVIATASVIIATQLASTEGQDGSRIRTTEAVKARGVAEYCVDVADAFVQATGTGNEDDFDRLLDPDGIQQDNGSGDDYLPPAGLMGGTGTIVSVPPGQTKAIYKYRAYQITSSSACLLRFDDNYDDGNLNLDSTLDDPGIEGLLINVPQRDRDRTVIITAIGVAHVAGIDIDKVYEKAHAVATVKRVRAMPVSTDDGLAIHAGGTVSLDKGSICGSIGGITADKVVDESGGGPVCVCGVLNAEPQNSVNQGNQSSPCPSCTECGGNSGSNTDPGAREDPTIEVPPRPAFMANEAFGLPGSSSNDIGAGPCLIYARDDDSTLSGADPIGPGVTDGAQIFVWDKNDVDVGKTMDAYEGAGITVTGEAEDADDVSCASNTSDPVPTPCTWTRDATTKKIVAIDCVAGESPCWKLVAHLGDGAGVVDFDPVRASDQAEQASTSGSNPGTHFTPRTGTIPNVVNNSGGTPPTWNNLCRGCTTCGGTSSIQITGDRLRLGSGTALTAANFPTPAILIFETANADAATDATAVPSAELLVAPGATTPSAAIPLPRLRVITNGGIALDGDTKLCDPFSTCPEGDFVALAQAVHPPPSPCGSDDSNVLAMEPTGFAIISGGNLLTNGKSFGIVGRIDVGTFESANKDCLVGNLVAHDPKPGVLDCPGTDSDFCDTASTVCFKNTGNLTGGIAAHGNICFFNNTAVSGTIQTEGSIAWKNNGTIDGQIMALGDVVGKNNASVTFDGSGASATTGAQSEMWMESSW